MTYSAPDLDANSEDNDGCFQFCVTDSPDMVQSCLSEKLEPYEHDNGAQQFECFNVGSAKNGQRSTGGYDSAGVRLSGGSKGMMAMTVGLTIVGAVLGAM